MIQTLKNTWSTPELRKKLILIFLVLLVFRFGNSIPVPFIDTHSLQGYFNSASNSILGMMNVMSGGAFGAATIFALSVQPYINASIIIQLLTVAIPSLEKMQKDEGEAGRKKLEQITRYSTLILGLLQGFGYYMLIRHNDFLSNKSVWAAGIIVLSFTAGSILIMWLGERITEAKVLGNGISVLLFAGIVSRLPNACYYMYTGVKNWANKKNGDNIISLHPAAVLVLVVGVVLMLMAVVYITLSERRIPIQYAKQAGRHALLESRPAFMPMKVNMSGVMPIIFAQTITFVPATIAAFVPSLADSTFMKLFSADKALYNVIYLLLIIGFAYFYATIQFNTTEVANNLKKQGGFIPGYRAGVPTIKFLSYTLNRITLVGAMFLAIIAILPNIAGATLNATSIAIGGTSALIVVSVALESWKSLQSQEVTMHYKGFLLK